MSTEEVALAMGGGAGGGGGGGSGDGDREDVHDDACLYHKEVYDYEDMNVRRGREKARIENRDIRALTIIHDPFLMQ